MQVMNSNGFEKGQEETDPIYAARMKALAEQLSSDLATSKQETQKWKKTARNAFIAAALLFSLFVGYLLWDRANAPTTSYGTKPNTAAAQPAVCLAKAPEVPPVTVNVTQTANPVMEVGSGCNREAPKETKSQPKKAKKSAKAATPSAPPASAPAAPASTVTSSSAPTHCRWASDGTLRLKSNPLRVLPKDETVATFPKADLKPGETCNTWQKALEAVQADLVSRDKATLR